MQAIKSINYFTAFSSSWKQQLQKKHEEAECTKDTIKILVQNILPAHVGKKSLPKNKITK